MEDIQDHLKDIKEMRALMERNSKFLSLSGLSGVSAGICALIGALVAWQFLDGSFAVGQHSVRHTQSDLYFFFFLDAGLVMLAALLSATFFSLRMAKKKKLPVWTPSSKQLLINLILPLVSGAAFCLILLWHGVIALIPASMLIFYGLSLLNASKYTLAEIKWLAISEIILGLLCAIWVEASLIFWAIGFGILHIIYGIVMYMKYER